MTPSRSILFPPKMDCELCLLLLQATGWNRERTQELTPVLGSRIPGKASIQAAQINAGSLAVSIGQS